MATRAAPVIACFAVFVSIVAVQVPSFLDQSATTATTAEACPLDGAVLQVMLPLAAMDALFTAVAFIYGHHLHHAADAGNRRLTGVFTFIACASVGLLQFFLFVQQPSRGVDGGAQAHALRVAAVHALPAAAAVTTFFLGVTLIYVHVGNGGGGAGSGAVAGNGPVPELAVWVLTKTTLGAALICLMAIVLALYIK
ncbi:uncharacterized protein LOC133930677 isoform X2 [Phragmites australis]|uniref:uncharacterized protein LOC133930677 isoform X1 n=1 Tax=Phragmites australis TaxID=29695 RepID=UPI002D782245|nr:uncharacterized protein LOC133930677 isoform X1 [Phragmites australis]XP_062233363.1 uncharacterized protein LOC133930677 isoform X2 [Phragmites australis]